MKEEKAFYEALGRRIEQCRAAKNMSQERLGAALSPSKTRAAISNIETAKQRVLAHVLVDIAKALTVEVGSLIESPVPSQPVEPSALKKTLEASLPHEAAQLFTNKINQRRKLAAKGKPS